MYEINVSDNFTVKDFSFVGEHSYWFQGIPFQGLHRYIGEIGTNSFWSQGIPYQFLGDPFVLGINVHDDLTVKEYATKASELKLTVKPSGQGGDYTSLSAALSHISSFHSNLVTEGAYVTIEIDGDWSGNPDTTNSLVSGITTDAAHYILIYTTSACRHHGVWDTNHYLLRTTLNPLDIDNSYTYVFGLQVECNYTGASNRVGITVEANRSNIYIGYNIVKWSGSTSGECYGIYSVASDSNIFAYNNIIDGVTATGNAIGIRLGGDGSCRIYNNTVVNSKVGIGTSYQGAIAKNNLIYNCTNCSDGSTFATGTDYNVTSSATLNYSGGGANDHTSHTFTFSGSSYLLAPTDTGARGYGVVDNTYFSDDIRGRTRGASGTWDIGADELLWTFIDSNSAGDVSVTYTIQTAGNLLVFSLKTDSNALTADLVSDTKGHIWSLAKMKQAGAGSIYIFYTTAKSAGSFTVTLNYTYAYTAIHEYSPPAVGTITVDKTAEGSSSVYLLESGSFLTTQSKELIFAATEMEGTEASWTPGTNYNEREQATSASYISEDRSVGSIGTYTASATLSVTGYTSGIAVATFYTDETKLSISVNDNFTVKEVHDEANQGIRFKGSAVGSYDNTTPASVTTSEAVNTAIGDFIVVSLGTNNAGAASPNTVTDTAGNTYTARTLVSGVRVYWCIATNANASNYFTGNFTTGSGYAYIEIVACVFTKDSGEDISVETSTTNSGYGSSVDTSDLTSSELDTLWIVGLNNSSGRTVSVPDIGGAAFQLFSPARRLHHVYRIPKAGQTADFTATWDGGDTSYNYDFVVFKATTGTLSIDVREDLTVKESPFLAYGFPHTGILDDFNRAEEGPPPSSSWTKTWTEGGSFKVNASQQCAGTVSNWCEAYWNRITLTDLEVYIQIATETGADGEPVGVVANTVSSVGGSWSAQDGYSLELWVVGSGTDQLKIVRYDDGVSTTLASVSQELSNGDCLGLRIVGNRIFGYYKPSGGSWTQLLEAEDSTYPGAKYIGAGISNWNWILDDFGGGSYNYLSIDVHDDLNVRDTKIVSSIFIQGAGKYSSGSVPYLSQAFPSNVKAGNTIIVGIYSFSDVVGSGEITDTLLNSYTLDYAYSSNVAIFSASNITGGACTVTFTPDSNHYCAMVIAEFAGIMTASPCEDVDGTTGSSVDAHTPDVDLTTTDVLFGLLGHASQTSIIGHYPAEGEDFYDCGGSPTTVGLCGRFAIKTAGARSVGWTLGTSVGWHAIGAAYKLSFVFLDSTGDHKWSTAANWNIGVPSSTDAVTIGSSVSSLIIDTSASCKSLDMSGAASDFVLSGSSALSVAGNLTFKSSSSSHTYDGTITIADSSTITSNGETLACAFTIQPGAGKLVQLGDDLVTTKVDMFRVYDTCTFEDNNHNLTVYNFYCTNDPHIHMGNCFWTITGNDGGYAAFAGGANATATIDVNHVLRFTASSGAKGLEAPWNGASTYSTVWCMNGGSLYIYSYNNTINTLKIDPGCGVVIQNGTTQTITTLDAIGTSGNLITWTSRTPGSHYHLHCDSGIISVDYNDLHDCHAEGGATFKASVGRGNIDGGGNDGWDFTISIDVHEDLGLSEKSWSRYGPLQDRFPTGEPSEQWTASSGIPWQCVDDPLNEYDEDATYMYTSSAWTSQSFYFTAFDITSTAIEKLVITVRARRTGSNTTRVGSYIWTDSASYVHPGGVQTVTNEYVDYSFPYTVNPETGLAWTEADIEGTGSNALKRFGPYSADSEELRVTQCYATVVYTQDSTNLTINVHDDLAVSESSTVNNKTFFGHMSGGTENGWSSVGWTGAGGFTCPGTGAKKVSELSAYVWHSTTPNIRLALYADDRNGILVCEGSSEVAITASEGWRGHLSENDITWHNGYTHLEGGSTYFLVVAKDGNATGLTGYPTGSGYYDPIDYTGGFANYLGTWSSGWSFYARCGVEDYTNLDVVVHEDLTVQESVTASGGEAGATLSIDVHDHLDIVTKPGPQPTLTIDQYDSLTVAEYQEKVITTYYVNVYDSTTVAEYQDRLITTLKIDRYDSLTVLDSAQEFVPAYNLSVADLLTVQEEASGFITVYYLDVFEGLSVQDVRTVNTGAEAYYEVSVSDKFTVAEYQDKLLTIYYLSVADSFTAQEVAQWFIPALCVTVADSLTVLEVTTEFATIYYLNVFDGLSVQDYRNVNTGDVSYYEVSVGDNVRVSEYQDKLLTIYYLTVYDPLTVQEYQSTPVVTYAVNVSDKVNVSESVDRPQVSVNISVSDNATVQESLNFLTYPYFLTVFDPITVADVKTVNTGLEAYYEVSVADKVNVSEVEEGLLTKYHLNVYDSATVQEVAQEFLPALCVIVADLLTAKEATTDFITIYYLNVFEGLSVQDYKSINTGAVSYYEVPVYDGFTVQESQTFKLNPYFLTVYDPVTVQESLEKAITPLFVNVHDDATVAEYKEQVRTPVFIDVHDDATVAEYQGKLIPAYLIDKSESVSVQEYRNERLNPYYISQADNFTVSEYAEEFLPYLNIYSYDTLRVSEYLYRDVPINVSVQDNLAIIEYANRFSPYCCIDVAETFNVPDVFWYTVTFQYLEINKAEKFAVREVAGSYNLGKVVQDFVFDDIEKAFEFKTTNRSLEFDKVSKTFEFSK